MSTATGVDSGPASERRVVVGRQPITDRTGAVVAFELLYRSSETDGRPVTGEEMTARVVRGALSIGIDQLVGDKTMFCNAERSLLTGQTPVTLPPDRTVIEVLETVDIDDETVAGCRRLVEQGFRIALDDFVWRDGAERLLELAAVVKIDVQAMTRDEIVALVERCRPYDVVLLAEKVETDDDVAWALEQGFALFQGYAIERPSAVHGHTVAPSALARVELALTLLGDDLDLEDLEETLRREPGLVVQVLQMASHGSHRGMRRQVHTVREALVLLGTNRVRQWVALTLLGEQSDGTPDALVTALSRARMVELLARSRAVVDPEFAFTAGLLSALDVLMGAELAQLDCTLDLDPVLRAAAFRHEGPGGALVAEVLRYQERVRTADSDDLPSELHRVAAEAFAWTLPYLAGLEG